MFYNRNQPNTFRVEVVFSKSEFPYGLASLEVSELDCVDKLRACAKKLFSYDDFSLFIIISRGIYEELVDGSRFVNFYLKPRVNFRGKVRGDIHLRVVESKDREDFIKAHSIPMPWKPVSDLISFDSFNERPYFDDLDLSELKMELDTHAKMLRYEMSQKFKTKNYDLLKRLAAVEKTTKSLENKFSKNNSSEKLEAHDAICDICNKDIVGHRFKCLVCADYDLCQCCERQGKHAEHAMMRMVSKNTLIPEKIKIAAQMSRDNKQPTASKSKSKIGNVFFDPIAMENKFQFLTKECQKLEKFMRHDNGFPAEKPANQEDAKAADQSNNVTNHPQINMQFFPLNDREEVTKKIIKNMRLADKPAKIAKPKNFKVGKNPKTTDTVPSEMIVRSGPAGYMARQDKTPPYRTPSLASSFETLEFTDDDFSSDEEVTNDYSWSSLYQKVSGNYQKAPTVDVISVEEEEKVHTACPPTPDVIIVENAELPPPSEVVIDDGIHTACPPTPEPEQPVKDDIDSVASALLEMGFQFTEIQRALTVVGCDLDKMIIHLLQNN
ncbi:unnamed protein product [Caenorhabditis bovis]|uniref:ZZ-type domain-containing protein n=1 Tax=Caenorhabditis bovis TaxID=2654633 RepID=A0A8S1FBH7_9PELO|nr:unnamed protein product [Caenorhabditis bovis]